jgi:hypothetical protein
LEFEEDLILMRRSRNYEMNIIISILMMQIRTSESTLSDSDASRVLYASRKKYKIPWRSLDQELIQPQASQQRLQIAAGKPL